MTQTIKLIVYPVKDLEAAKKLFSKFLGVEPYADSSYYVGFKAGDLEVGLDPSAYKQNVTGPIVYIDVADIKAYLQTLLDAGAQVVQEVKEVVGGLLIASVKDANGNILGLRQSH